MQWLLDILTRKQRQSERRFNVVLVKCSGFEQALDQQQRPCVIDAKYCVRVFGAAVGFVSNGVA